MKIIPLFLLFMLASVSLASQNDDVPEPLIKGAYSNYYEFITNNPSIRDSFYVVSNERTHPKWTGTYSVTPRFSENNKTIKRIWGFCDGEQAYILHGDEYFPIIKEKDEYKFIGFDLIDETGYDADFQSKNKKTVYRIDPSLGVAIHPSIYQKQASQNAEGFDEYFDDTVTSETLALEPLVRGAYKTFNEFKTNNPSITEDFYVKKKARSHKSWLGTYSLKPKYVENNKRIKNIWGFSDGNQAYIMHQGEFFPILIENDQYTFLGFDIIDESGGVAAALLFGLIGAAVHTATTQSQARKNKTIYTIEPSKGLAVHPLEAENSFPTDMQGSSGDMLAIETRVIFYRMSKKELDSPVEFLVDDSATYSFIPDSYLAVKFKKGHTFMKVCYGAGFTECIEIVRNTFEDSYVLCTLPEKGGEPLLSLQKYSTGEFDSFKPRKAQRKREKARLKGK